MNELCFMTNLTSAEWAAWVQAVGSVVAILAAVLIAVLQARLQHRNDLMLQRTEQRQARVETAKTLAMLAKNSASLMKHVSDQLKDRESIYKAAKGLSPCDIVELAPIEKYLDGIPLHTLPHSLVSVTMILSGTVRQFKQKVEMMLRLHHQMDASNFENFFRVLGEMNNTIELTSTDISSEINRMNQDSTQSV